MSISGKDLNITYYDILRDCVRVVNRITDATKVCYQFITTNVILITL